LKKKPRDLLSKYSVTPKMALQIQNVLKSAKKLANTRALSSGVFSSSFDANMNQSSKLHLAVQREYPKAEQLPLPANINVAETACFSPLRNRDITSSAINAHNEMVGIDVTLDTINPEMKPEARFEDAHLGSYDRQGCVNLSSVMQSTVPEPFGGNQKISHLNMPGGSWGMQTKYLSHELNSSHYTELRQELRQDWSKYDEASPKVD